MAVRFKIVGKDYFDMFSDEPVTLIEKVQDFTKIDNSFSSFTYSLNIPATPKNLDLLEWYNRPEYTNALNPFTTIDAEMWVDSQYFSSGTIRLIQYDYTDTEPNQIQIQYLAEGSNLKKALTSVTGSPIKLAQLNNSWEDYAHSMSSSNVLSYLSGGNVLNLSGALTSLKYVAASQDYFWEWASATAKENTRQIASTNDGIVNTEVRPAIKLTEVMDAIFAQAGYDYEVAFDYDRKYYDLWMWIGNGKTFENGDLPYLIQAQTSAAIRLTTSATRLICGNVTQDSLNAYNEFSGVIITKESSDFRLSIKTSESTEWRYLINGVPSAWFSATAGAWDSENLLGLTYGDLIEIDVRSISTSEQVFITADIQWENLINTTTAQFVPSAFMPDISCTDFLLGVLRTFNAVIYYDASVDKYIIDNRLAWLQKGEIHDITPETSTTSHQLTPPDFYKTFSLKWKEGKDYLNANFEESNNRQFGSAFFGLDYQFGEDYELENTFTNTLWSEVVSRDANGNITFNSRMPSFQCVNPSIQDSGVRLMYYNNTKTLAGSYKVVDNTGVSAGTSSIINDFQNVLNAESFMLSYNAEYNYNVSTVITENMYTKFFADYVSYIYSPTLRKYKYKAYLTLPQIIDIKLNDTLKIGDRYYNINQKEINFLTGETQLELISAIIQHGYIIVNDVGDNLLIDDEGNLLEL